MFLRASLNKLVPDLRRTPRRGLFHPPAGMAGRVARRVAGLAIATWVLALAGCSFKTPQSIMDAHGLVARDQLDLFMVTVWVSLFIFVTVGGTMAVVVWKYRERPGDENKPMPEQGHGNPLIEISLITASIALLVIIAVPTMKAIFLTDALPMDQPYWKPSLLGSWYKQAGGELTDEKSKDEPLTIIVHGWQWWWSFEYPQFGIITANEFYIPAGKVVKFELRSNNVIHSFWVPKIAGKVDLIPGRANWMWMMADDGKAASDGYDHGPIGADQYENGLYYGQCAQYCGEAHAFMLFRTRVVNDKDFVAWVEHTLTPVKAPIPSGKWGDFIGGAKGDPDSNILPDKTMLATPEQRGAFLFFTKGSCIQCHTIDGTPATATIGPNLSRVASRTSLVAGFLDNLDNDGKAIDPVRQRNNFYNWISHPYDLKPGNLMWYPQPGTDKGGLRDIVQLNINNKTPITDQDWRDIAAFLMTLK